MMNDIKAVLFDYDDTLADSLKAKWAQHTFVAKHEYNKDLNEAELRLHWTKPYSELVMALYGDDNKERAIKNNKKHESKFPKHLLPETIVVLEQLHARTIITGVITSTSASSLQNDLDRYNFPSGLLDYIQAEEATEQHKPDARVFNPFLLWAATHSIQKNQVLYVGDGLHDMKAAKDAGFNFIGITTGLISKQVFDEHAVMSIDNLLELPKLVK